MNREFPDFAHRIEIDFSHYINKQSVVRGWYNGVIIISSLPSGRVLFHTRKDVLEVYG